MDKLSILIVFILFNSDTLFFKALRYIIFFFMVVQIWANLKLFHFKLVFSDFFFLIILFSPRIILKISKVFKIN